MPAEPAADDSRFFLIEACEELTMSSLRRRLLARDGRASQEGKVGWILLWLLGIPIPVLLVLFLLRGCT